MDTKKLIQEAEDMILIEDCDELKKQYVKWCSQVESALRNEGLQEEVRESKVKMHYTENEYSEAETRNSILKALQSTIGFLEKGSIGVSNKISKETANLLVEQILDHFHLYLQAMYRDPVHKSGTLCDRDLKAIEVGNEYDLQRMVYSVLRPLFPIVRQEVYSDNGCGGMRADLYLEDYNMAIEMKCTRQNMTEKKLIEELGADGFHYREDTIFFFVYDKAGIVKNPEALRRAFTREKVKDGKTVKLCILQPIKW